MPNAIKVVICFSGKRKSGKDFVSARLLAKIREEFEAELVGISWSLKDEFAAIEGVDKEELKTDGPMKEVYRKRMVDFGEEKRKEDPSYFCRAAISSLNPASSVAIITDCRRATDLAYFGSQSYKRITVRIEAPLEVRESRGFKFTRGIDDAETECALDAFPEKWDFVIQNAGVPEKLEMSLNEIFSSVCDHRRKVLDKSRF
ncbi:hypothetical protein L596_028426 [Steinernema carpocapsae]|uniref:Phosphomevalonate kinase n=1 Tax=Steinernema carpocapsae TaxID=34508 RepID=A0A4U5LYE8_STECR|nr:hypothetical protein L596_028426 [Steinernema carpocapsae]